MRDADHSRAAPDRERSLGDQLACLAVDRQLLGDRDPEQPDHLARPLDNQPRIFDRQLAVDRDEARVDLGDLRAATRRDARAVEQTIRDLQHAACVEVVVAHQRLDRRPDSRANVAVGRFRMRIQGRRDALLDLERQLVEAPLRDELHEDADAELEVPRVDQDLGLSARQLAHRHERFDHRLRGIGIRTGSRRMPAHRRRPQRRRQIAQRADPHLQVRLEQVQRRAESRVTRLLLAASIAIISFGFPPGDSTPSVARVSSVVSRRSPAMWRASTSAVAVGEIVFRQTRGRTRFANRVADRELVVPQRIEQPIRGLLRRRRVVIVKDDEVDIGVRRQLAARPAAGRDECQRCTACRRFEPRRDRSIVDVGDRASSSRALPRLPHPVRKHREQSIELGSQAVRGGGSRRGHLYPLLYSAIEVLRC